MQPAALNAGQASIYSNGGQVSPAGSAYAGHTAGTNAAVNSLYKYPLAVFGELEQLFGHLLAQLARRAEDKPLDAVFFRVDGMEQRQPECRRFAGAGLCLANKIGLFVQQNRDYQFLYFCGYFYAELFYSFDKLIADT